MPQSQRAAGAKVVRQDTPADDWVPLVYAELRLIAAQYLRRERRNHTLQPTMLVHEAYLRLAERGSVSYRDRAHFLATAARVMRHLLVDHARARNARKRGGGWNRITLDESMAVTDNGVVEVLAVDEALRKLAARDPIETQVVELGFFGGLTQAEIAAVCGRSERWVRDQMCHARAWLARELQP